MSHFGILFDREEVNTSESCTPIKSSSEPMLTKRINADVVLVDCELRGPGKRLMIIGNWKDKRENHIQLIIQSTTRICTTKPPRIKGPI